MFSSRNSGPKSACLTYLVAIVLFAVSAITNFIGDNTMIGALSLLGLAVVAKTYYELKKDQKDTKQKNSRNN